MKLLMPTCQLPRTKPATGPVPTMHTISAGDAAIVERQQYEAHQPFVALVSNVSFGPLAVAISFALKFGAYQRLIYFYLLDGSSNGSWGKPELGRTEVIRSGKNVLRRWGLGDGRA